MLFGASGRAAAQTQPGDELTISLVTVGSNAELFSWTGHAAVLVANRRGSQPLLFDYGVVPVGPVTTRSLVHGNVIAYATARDPAVLFPAWRAAGRTIRVQELALAPAQRTALRDSLVAAEAPDRRAYFFEYRTNNCTTRIRDLLDQVLGGALRRAGTSPTGETIRTIGYQILPVNLGVVAVDIVMNDDVDRPLSEWDAALFPVRLAALVARTSVPDGAGMPHSLVVAASDTTHFLAPSPVAMARDQVLFPVIGVVLSAMTLGLGRFATNGGPIARAIFGGWLAIVGGTLGAVGTLLAAGWGLTHYAFAPHNENLLLFNPALLAAVPLGLAYAMGVTTVTRWLLRLAQFSLTIAVAGLLLKVTNAFDQNNWRTMSWVLPLLAATTGTLSHVPKAGIPV